MEPKLCFIKEAYFVEHDSFIKMLDTDNSEKQSKRTHLCILIQISSNKFYIPLRNNLGEAVRKFGRIGHAIPSEKRLNAGLDYRYALIINDDKYIEICTEQRIPEAQYRKIKQDYEQITNEFTIYIKGYLKALKKNRIDKEPLYRESSLINYIAELKDDVR